MAINVVQMNVGPKIDYEVRNDKIIAFGDDDLTIKLPSYERDEEVNLDICLNEWGMLVMGQGQRYVAQVNIPPRAYEEVEESISKNMTGGSREVEKESQIGKVKKPLPFDIDRCTLSLWSLKDTNWNPSDVDIDPSGEIPVPDIPVEPVEEPEMVESGEPTETPDPVSV